MENIIDGLWPQDPPRSAVENVRTYVSQLRDILHRPDDGSTRLESHHGGYRLTVAPDQVDLQRFAALANSGRQALQAGDFPRAARLLDDAMQLWRGNPLRELELGPAIRAKTIALEEHHWRVQADWIRARLALDDHVRLVPTLRELLGERPLEETLWCFLVTALYRSGRTGEALTVFAQARRVFISELGIEPGPQLRALQAKVLAGVDLGQSDVRAPHTDALAPHQLPAPCPGFVGRHLELRHIQKLAERARAGAERVPVAAISGLPGSGKTATAIAAAAAALCAFPDGQLFVDLRGSTADPLDPVDALTSMLVGLGVPPDVIPGDLVRCCYLYRSVLAGRRVLIVLDDAAHADQVTPLIPGPGQSMVITTARRWMAGVDADLRLGLMPLDTDEALSMLGNLTGMNRVRHEPASATEIITACCGLPTAIRIAGSRLAARPKLALRHLADRFRESFGMLDEFSLTGSRCATRSPLATTSSHRSSRNAFARSGSPPPMGSARPKWGRSSGFPCGRPTCGWRDSRTRACSCPARRRTRRRAISCPLSCTCSRANCRQSKALPRSGHEIRKKGAS